MVLKFRWLLTAVSFLYFFCSIHPTFGFIERHYTLPEIIDSSTNIVFGTVESVDKKKLRTVVKVDQDVTGKSGLKKIRINLAVGQRRGGSSPEEMVKYFHKRDPVVIFYDKHSGQLNSVGHVGGKWFQCKTLVGDGKDWKDRWWTFTHIEIHMHRTFSGETDKLQKRVREVLQKTNPILASKPAPEFDKASGNHIKVMILSNRKYPAELRTLRQIRAIDEYQFAYQDTDDTSLPELEKASILWLGYRSLGEGRYLLNNRSENRIKNFVKNGGVLIVSGQDSEAIPMGWFSGKLKGVEYETQMGIHPNKNSGDIFQKPNKIETKNIYTEDSWNNWGKNFIVLATTNDRRNVALGMLNHGKGMYLITSLHHETYFQASSNGRLMENLIYSAAKHLDDTSSGKIQYASIETDKVKPIANPVQQTSASADKSEEISVHISIPKKINERLKNKNELRNRIEELQKRFSTIQKDIVQLEKESKRDEGASDELENRVGKLQLEFSTLRKNIAQLEKESEQDVDKSESIQKEKVEEKEPQAIPAEVLPKLDIYYKEVNEVFSRLQQKINEFNQEITTEFSDSKSDLEAIEKRLERFRKSMSDAKSSLMLKEGSQ